MSSEAPGRAAPQTDAAGTVGEWLTRLDVVARQSRFYPSDHPAIGPALEALEAAGHEAGRQTVVLEVTPEGFLMARGDLGAAATRTRRLATQLFQLGLVAVIARLPMNRDDLLGLAAVLAGLTDRPTEEGRQEVLTAVEAIPGIDFIPLDASSFVFSNDLRASLGERNEQLWRQMVAEMTGGIVSAEDGDLTDPSEVAAMIDGAADPLGFVEVLVEHLVEMLGEAEGRGTYLDGLALLTSAEEMIRAIHPANQHLVARLLIQAADGVTGMRAHLPEILPVQLFLDGIEAMLAAEVAVPGRVRDLLEAVARGQGGTGLEATADPRDAAATQARAESLLARLEASNLVSDPTRAPRVPWRDSAAVQGFLGSMQPGFELGASLEEESVRRHFEDMLRTVYQLWPSGFTSAAVGTRLVERYFDHLQLGEFFEASELVSDLLASGSTGRVEPMVGAEGVDAILDAVSLWGKEHWSEVDHIVTLLGAGMVPALLDRLQDEEAMSRRKRLLEMVAAIGRESIPMVARLLEDSRWFVVRNGLLLLRRLNARDQVEAIATTAVHPDPRVASEAVKCLAAFGDPRWLEAFQRLLSGDERAVREAITLATRIRSPDIGPLLASKLATLKAGDFRFEENLELIEAAGLQRGAAVADQLERILGLSQWRVPFRLTPAWEAVVRAASRMADADGERVLRRAAQLKDPAARSAERALAKRRGGGDGRS